ncbi:hypothetical protein BJ912DRAFT_668350 [Pholiota molesta]|nr:hypothetical protein BJ912DRAFT_668350 [Pholiota molesta]
MGTLYPLVLPWFTGSYFLDIGIDFVFQKDTSYLGYILHTLHAPFLLSCLFLVLVASPIIDHASSPAVIDHPSPIIIIIFYLSSAIDRIALSHLAPFLVHMNTLSPSCLHLRSCSCHHLRISSPFSLPLLLLLTSGDGLNASWTI